MDIYTDIVIVGTGAAGLTAALKAQAQGAEVVVIEKSAQIGGTTAVSGGAIWVPNNHHMSEIDASDSADEAFQYVKRLTESRSDDEVIQAYVTHAAEMVQFVEAHTDLEFKPLPQFPDYYPHLPGGKTGRSLDPGLFDANQLGEWRDKLRQSPIYSGLVVSVNEMADLNAAANPLGLPFPLIQERAEKGIISFGAGLIGQLLKSLLKCGIEPHLNTRATELITDGRDVTGVIAEKDGQTIKINARKGVILASGGFEWNQKLVRQFLGGTLTHPCTPPTNEGDGLLMAMAVGSDLGNMSEAWWSPAFAVPEESYEGRPLYRADFANRSLPHAIIVNGNGERFVNESHNYNDLMKAFFTFDPHTYSRPNLNAWLILESRHLQKYGFLTYLPVGMPIPDWLITGDTVEALAAKIDIDPEKLAATINRFNQFAQSGIDEDFHRGESPHDHIYSDPNNSPNPNIGSLSEAPFYAFPIHPGALGTKGGVKVNQYGQALDTAGQPINRLYAAGNVMAGVTGAGYPGAGCTISSAMTFGFITGEHAAKS